MSELAWVYRGPLATGSDFVWMDADDLAQAERDGWAQRVVGTGEGMFPSSALNPIEPGPHPAAEAYAARRQRGESGYPTRELVAGSPPAPKPPAKIERGKDDDEEDLKPTNKPKQATKPTKK